jgi:hypothetical protein
VNGSRFGQRSDSPALDALLRESANHVLSPREIWLQRVSFAYGNIGFDNPRITREIVEKMVTKIYGPCPPESGE